MANGTSRTHLRLTAPAPPQHECCGRVTLGGVFEMSDLLWARGCRRRANLPRACV